MLPSSEEIIRVTSLYEIAGEFHLKFISEFPRKGDAPAFSCWRLQCGESLYGPVILIDTDSGIRIVTEQDSAYCSKTAPASDIIIKLQEILHV